MWNTEARHTGHDSFVLWTLLIAERIVVVEVVVAAAAAKMPMGRDGCSGPFWSHARWSNDGRDLASSMPTASLLVA